MAKTRVKGQLVKTSNFIQKELIAFEKEVVDYVAEKLNITSLEAEELLKEDKTWNMLMEQKRKAIDLDMVDLISDFKGAIKAKIEKGSLEQAKSGMTGIAIAYDKLYKTREPKSSMKIEGTNIQVNIPFNYKNKKAKGVKKNAKS